MKKLKLIRIDETPRRFLGISFKILRDRSNIEEDIINPSFSLIDKQLRKNAPYFFLKGIEEEEQSRLRGIRDIGLRNYYPENNVGEIDVPPYFIEQIIRINNLILEFNSDLEQRKVSKDRIEEFQYDSFKIGLRILEGILLQFSRSWLASRQFDLAEIHAENTIITLENFEEDKIGSGQRIKILKDNCEKLILIIRKLKEYFGLDKL